MSKNKVQFQKGLSLTDFMAEYGDEQQCRSFIFHHQTSLLSGTSYEQTKLPIKHPAASSRVLISLFNLLVFNQLSPQGAGN